MRLALISPPAVEPVALDEAKNWLRVADAVTEDDALIQGLIVAARASIEAKLWRALTTQTWDLQLDAFPCDLIRLPKPPLQSVSSISYVDEDGATQTWASSNYIVTAPVGPHAGPGSVSLAYEKEWPTTRAQANAVTVRFLAGYGDSWNDIPPPIRQALLYLVKHWYDVREPVAVGTIAPPMPLTVEYLIEPYRALEFA